MATERQQTSFRIIRGGYPTWVEKNPVPDDLCDMREATAYLTAFHEHVDPLVARKYWTVESKATVALIDCGSVTAAYAKLFPLVGSPELTFSANVNGSRVAKPISDQYEELHKLLKRIAKHGNSVTRKGRVEDSSDEAPVPVIEKVESVPMPAGDAGDLLRRLDRCRDYAASRKADGTPLDDVGLRPYVNAAKMFSVGITVDAILHATFLTWPQDARDACGIRAVDITRDGLADRETIPGEHPALPYILRLVKAQIPVMLIGPKGTGKTTLAKSVADKLKLDTAALSCNAQTGNVQIFGRQKPLAPKGEDFIPSALWNSVVDGGVFLFDELDAIDANANLAVNQLLANRTMTNPYTGDTVTAHDNFVPMSAANTTGLGADRTYQGRERLDGASLDRWASGRVEIHFDATLAHKLFADNS